MEIDSVASYASNFLHDYQVPKRNFVIASHSDNLMMSVD